MSKNNGGSAFPQGLCIENEFNGSKGMTLRDYFAAQALIALSSSYGEEFGKPTFTEETRRAYECADAMLKARES